MTAPTVDPWRTFRELLPRYVHLHDTQRAVGLVTAAIGKGWTPQQLARECSRDLAGVANSGGVVTYRLEQAAQHAPQQAASRARIPFCGKCGDGWIEDPETRLPAVRCECRRKRD